MDPLNTATEVAPNIEELTKKALPSWYGPRMQEAQRLLDERRAARKQANDSFGFSDYAADIAKAPARGIEGALTSVSNIATKPVRWALSKAGVEIPDLERKLGRSETTAGGVVEGLTQFLTGSLVTGGAAGAVARGLGAASELAGAGLATKAAAQVAAGLTEGTISASAARGAITDFSAFGEHEERLSNLIQEFPSLSNPVTQYLQATDDDNAAEGRLKNAVEGLIVGGAAEVVFKSLKAFKNGYTKILKGGDANEVNPILKSELHSPEFQAKVEQSIKETEQLQAGPESQQALDPINVQDIKNIEQAKADLKLPEHNDLEISKAFRSAFDEYGPLPTAINFNSFGNTNEDFNKILKAAGRTVDERFKTKEYGTLKDEGHAMAADVVQRMSDNPEIASQELKQLAMAGEEQVKAVIAAGDIMNSATFGLQNHIDTWLDPNTFAKLPAWDRQKIDAVLGRYVRTMGEARKVKSYSGMALQANRAKKVRHFTEAELRQQNPSAVIQSAADKELEAELAQQTQTLLKLGDEELRTLLADIQALKDPADAAKLLRDATTKIHPGYFKKGYDTLLTYFRSSLLSRIPTHVTNIVGGTMNQGILMAQRAIGGELKNAMRQARGTLYSTLEASKAAWQAFKHGPILESTTLLDKPMRNATIKRSAFSKGPFGDAAYFAAKAMNVPFRLLVASDEFMKQTTARGFLYADLMERGEKAGLKGNNLKSYVDSEMTKAIDAQGKFWSFDNTMKRGYDQANLAGITDRAERFKFATRYAEEQATKTMSAETMDAIERAKRFGQEVTFQTDLDPNSMHGRIGKFINETPVLNLFVPFYKTPINIFKQAFRNTPILGQINDVMMKELTHADPERAAMARGRAVQAAIMLPSIAALAANGTITGHGPSNPRERSILIETGWKPYSVRVGDTYVSYQRFDPLAIPVGIIADMVEHWNDGHEASDLSRVAATLTSAFAWNIGNKSYLKGMSELMGTIAAPTGTRMQTLGRGVAAPLVPGIFKDIKRIVETNENDPMKDVRTLMDAWIDRIPYGEKMFGHILDRRYNALGEPVKYATGAIENAITIAQRSKLKHDPITDELASISAALSRPSSIMGGPGGADLKRIRAGDQSAYGRYQELVGQVRIEGKSLRQKLGELIRSNEYKRLGDEKIETETGTMISARESKVRAVIRAYRNAARQQLQREIPELRTNLDQLKRLKRDTRTGKAGNAQVRKFIDQMQ